jgi:tetratricopeptide (TPR) repeat protein
MLNGRFPAYVRPILSLTRRSAMLISSFFLLATAPIWGQIYYGNPYDARLGLSRRYEFSMGGLPGTTDDGNPNFPRPANTPEAGTISSDILRNPLSSKARRMLEKARHNAEMGDHTAAIEGLRDALVKQPAAAPYIHSLLGIEYLETRQFAAAVLAFEKSARLMPHEAATHSNFGLSLAVAGQFDRAEKELRKALELDHTNTKAKGILEALLVAKRTPNQAAGAAGPKP